MYHSLIGDEILNNRGNKSNIKTNEISLLAALALNFVRIPLPLLKKCLYITQTVIKLQIILPYFV